MSLQFSGIWALENRRKGNLEPFLLRSHNGCRKLFVRARKGIWPVYFTPEPFVRKITSDNWLIWVYLEKPVKVVDMCVEGV